MHFYLLPFPSDSHVFTRADSNPGMNQVMGQEADQEESKRTSLTFEILTAVQALPLTPHSSHNM